MAGVAALVLVAAAVVGAALGSDDAEADLTTQCAAVAAWSDAFDETDDARDLPALELRTRELAAVIASKRLRSDLDDLADEVRDRYERLPRDGGESRAPLDDLPGFGRFVGHAAEMQWYSLCPPPVGASASTPVVPERAPRFCDELRKRDTRPLRLDEPGDQREKRERVATWRKRTERLRDAAPPEIRPETDRIVDYVRRL